MRELEHERDQVEGDEEGKEELDVLRHGRAGLLDARQRRLAGEEVAVGLDRDTRFAIWLLSATRQAEILLRFAAIVAAICGRARVSSAAAAFARRASRL